MSYGHDSYNKIWNVPQPVTNNLNMGKVKIQVWFGNHMFQKQCILYNILWVIVINKMMPQITYFDIVIYTNIAGYQSLCSNE